jgi:hypothetical protein
MVMMVNSMEFKEGKGKEAREYLKRFNAYEKKVHGKEFQILQRVTPAAGQSARLMTISTYSSLAAWGEHEKKDQESPEWQALVDEGFRSDRKIFVHNSFSRALFEVI